MILINCLPNNSKTPNFKGNGILNLKNFYYMKNKDIVFGRENSTEYNYSKGYLIGIITALNLEWTETDKQAIIINRNDETVFYTLDFKSEKGVII